jgi:hypothetical protein
MQNKEVVRERIDTRFENEVTKELFTKRVAADSFMADMLRLNKQTLGLDDSDLTADVLGMLTVPSALVEMCQEAIDNTLTRSNDRPYVSLEDFRAGKAEGSANKEK